LKVARTDKSGKTWWTKIGVMFPMKERDGFNITLEALPLQTMNEQGQMECRITAWEPYKDDMNSSASRPIEPSPDVSAPKRDDPDIPF
jgi:hypothetical protein